MTHISREAWKRNKGVVYFSFEMDVSRVTARFLSPLVDIPHNKIPTQPKKTIRRFTRYRDSHEITAGFKVIRYSDHGATVAELMRQVDTMREDGRQIDLVVVDYGDIVEPVGRFNNEHDRQKSVFEDLRAMATDCDVPVWTATQTTREALRKKRITLIDIGNSFAKAKTADYIIALCQTDDEKKVNFARLYFAKTRNSGQGEEIPVNADFAYTRFEQAEFFAS